MSINEESPFADNPMMEAYEVRAYEAGVSAFEEFIPIAVNSNIPVTLRDAVFAQIVDLEPDIHRDVERGDFENTATYSKELATRLFEKEFGTSPEAGYAVDYALAVALYKSWQIAVQENSEAFHARMEIDSAFMNIFGLDLHPDPATALEQLEALNLEGHEIVDKMKLFLRSSISDRRGTEKMKRLAISQCGQMTLSEQRLKELDDNVLRRTFSALTGNSIESQREISSYIENYFKKPRNVTRMYFLGQGKRI
jgi:hypothetical protein